MAAITMLQWIRLSLLILILIVSAISLVFVTIIYEDSRAQHASGLPSNIKEEWNNWCRKYNMTFDSFQETMYRFSVWRKNYELILNHNAREDGSYKMGLNQFTYLEHWEFVEMYLRTRGTSNDADSPEVASGNITIAKNNTITKGDCYLNNFDWRDKFSNRAARDQKRCGSCWAFASAAAVEWHWAIYHGSSLTLSTQNLIDCVRLSYGCSGGSFEDAFLYIQDRGILLEKDYPYQSRVTQCSEDPKKVALKLKGYETLVGLDENSLACVVQRVGPIVVGFDFSGIGLQHYASGIYDETDCSHDFLNHALVLVGFGIDSNGNQYWIAQNSFSQNWGENGFLRLKFGINLCGLSILPALPVV
ncbi:hypothetical protein Aperf_G00000072645 [Anoplocephala perfoliata]